MQITDNLYLGAAALPTSVLNEGAGPLGRIAFHNIVPLVLQAANVAALQHTVAATALTLAAGTGATAGTAPDGSGRTVIVLDCNRCVSLTSTANLSGMTVTVTGFDLYGRLQTSTLAGPNNNSVATTKAFASVLSVVPSATDASNNISVGTADKFGVPWAIYNKGYVSIKWKDVRTEDTGTFVDGDATSPATASTTDPRGTYVPSDAADGSKRLVVWMHLTESQVGPSATMVGAIGVTPV